MGDSDKRTSLHFSGIYCTVNKFYITGRRAKLYVRTKVKEEDCAIHKKNLIKNFLGSERINRTRELPPADLAENGPKIPIIAFSS
jgi:hypothetical protein